MIEATVLLEDGEEVTFTAADMVAAAWTIEQQYYPYIRVDMIPVEGVCHG